MDSDKAEYEVERVMDRRIKGNYTYIQKAESNTTSSGRDTPWNKQLGNPSITLGEHSNPYSNSRGQLGNPPKGGNKGEHYSPIT